MPRVESKGEALPQGRTTFGLGARFAVSRELGRGAASVVLEARDRLHDLPVAIKLATTPGQAPRYREEYRRLLEFRHPNIVRALDFGFNAEGFPYYTQELVTGQNLAAFADRREPETLAVLTMQVLDALAMIHARGWVHRDVKPRNLLVVGHGTASMVRLIDFGLLARCGERTSAAGTLPYMAPEVARGEPADGRADLFSLGVVLYETLLPAETARTVEEVSRWMAVRPEPPSRIDPTIPSGLSDLIMRLCDPDPEQRPAHATEAADALARVPDLGLSRGPDRAAAERLLRGGAVSHRSRIVGRLKRLSTQVREERRGRMVVIEGETGVGKTPLLRELSMQLNLDGFRVARLRTTNRPGSPVMALLRAARAIAPDVPAPTPQASALLDPRARLSEISAFAGQVGVTVVATLGADPTALIIDDLHRAEPVALEALRSLAGEIDGAPLLVIAAGDRRADGITLADALGVEEEAFNLKPLSDSEVEEMVAHRLNRLTMPRPALERLVRDSQGMPSLVERTLAQLLVDHTIEPHGHLFVFAGGRYRPATHADADMVAARIALVREEQRPVLWAAAVLGGALDAGAVGAVAGLAVERAGSILGELARLEILDLGEATSEPIFAFASRHVLAAVYQKIPQELRRTLHDRAAAFLESNERGGRRVEDRVEHLLKGSNDDRAVAAAVEAGDRAAELFADRRAIEYYARAYARLPAAEDRRAPPIALRLGRLFQRTGELERAAVWFQAAAAGAAESEVAIEATLGLGTVAHVRGMPADAERHAARALELLQARRDPRLSALAHRLQALVAAQRGESGRAEALFGETLRELEASGATAELIAVLLDLGRLNRERGEIFKAVTFARRAQRHARAIGDVAAIAEAAAVIGRGFLRAARFSAAKRALFHGLRVARASGDRLRQGLLLREIGNLRIREGDLEGALERYERSLELVRAARARADEGAALHNIGVVRTRLGELRAALAALQAALQICRAMGDVQGAASTAVELGHTLACAGDLVRAAAELRAAVEAGGNLGDAVIAAEAGALLAWVEVRQGNAGAGHRLLGTLDDLLAPLEDPANRGLALVYAVRCALLLGESRKAVRLADSLKSVVEEGALGDLRPEALGLRGRALMLLGDRDRATDLLMQGILAAQRAHLLPLEIDLRTWLGRLLFGTVPGMDHLTGAMERLRDLVTAQPLDLARLLLATREAVELRADFIRGAQQLDGEQPAP